jgi:hypothetical protein
MKNSVNNQFGVAPDEGIFGEPMLKPMVQTVPMRTQLAFNTDYYWLFSLRHLGQSAFAPDGYQFTRNCKEFRRCE